MKEEYIVEGYLTDKFGNPISSDFQYKTMASSFIEAERNAVFTIKTRDLHLPRNFPAKLQQTEGIHFTHRRARDV